MWSYILKRMLLMIPTLLGVLTLTFAVIQFVPGGPVEQSRARIARAAEQGASVRHAHAYGRGCAADRATSERSTASTNRRSSATG